MEGCKHVDGGGDEMTGPTWLDVPALQPALSQDTGCTITQDAHGTAELTAVCGHR